MLLEIRNEVGVIILIERCIMIFPNFENGHVIDKIRDKYDPLAKHVRPHITMVFPFESDIETSELKNHLTSVLAETKPFEIILNGVTPTKSFGNYLFLNVVQGNDEIIEIHKSLYTGILEKFFPVWLKDGLHKPHMTVGKVENEQEFLQEADSTKDIKEIFKTIVNKISVEIIDENEDSVIEMEIELEQLLDKLVKNFLELCYWKLYYVSVIENEMQYLQTLLHGKMHVELLACVEGNMGKAWADEIDINLVHKDNIIFQSEVIYLNSSTY